MPWPHGPACTCPVLPPDAGLLNYTTTCQHHAQLAQTLDRIAGQPAEVRLRVLTRGPKPDNLVTPHRLAALVSLDRPTCDQTMTCRCETCTKDRLSRVRQGTRQDRNGGIPIRRRAA